MYQEYLVNLITVNLSAITQASLITEMKTEALTSVSMIPNAMVSELECVFLMHMFNYFMMTSFPIFSPSAAESYLVYRNDLILCSSNVLISFIWEWIKM